MKKKLFAVLFAALLGLNTGIPSFLMERTQTDNNNTVSLLYFDDSIN